ncbi:MAG: YmfQ family protein [Lachnospiraceae bacterium]|nr:YmfQ family protein [Lachnospiraceae bacterium]
MIRDVRLIEHLPPFVQQYREIKAIMDAENPEVQTLENATETIKNNQFIVSCNLAGIARYEQLIGITPDPYDTLDARISRVLIRWNDKAPYTKWTLKNRLDTLCGEGEYTIDYRYDDYEVDIDTNLELSGQVKELERIINTMIPANLVVNSNNKMPFTIDTPLYYGGTVVVCEALEIADTFNGAIAVSTGTGFGGVIGGYEEIKISDE